MTIALGAFGHGFLGIKPVEAAIAAPTSQSRTHRLYLRDSTRRSGEHWWTRDVVTW